MSQFELDTAVEERAPNRYVARIDDRYWVQAGPNGGFLCAVALRAARASVPEQERQPRSLHARFLAPPAKGYVELEVELLRSGRSMSSVAISMRQGGRLCFAGSACFGAAYSDIAFQDRPMPAVPPIEHCSPVEKRIALNHRYDMFRAIGDRERKGERAHTGGYIRFAEPHVIDAFALAALWDAWPPAAYARRIEQHFRGSVPTVEASLYFRRVLPLPDASPTDFVLLEVDATMAHDGFVEESAELWSLDGQLLAQSRQLALLF